MRRNSRRKDERTLNEDFGIKRTLYIAGAIVALGIIAFFVTIIVYNNNLEKIYSDLEITRLGETVEDEEADNAEETSSILGKTVDESEEEIEEVSAENEEADETASDIEKKEEEESKNTQSESSTVAEANDEVEEEEEEETEPDFIAPVDGEIIKKFAKDSLVYSETLKEWVTHLGIDIAADKATVVKASASGTVTAIKNDPRYGTTVIIEHSAGYETRYANLLTAEFVSVGEEVSEGQTIGTVGNTATFEIADEYHLHFEILKDGEYVDPELYIY